ncbi:MAG: TlpA disulfide reductase family protein [Rikenellaceae bacterium]
MRVRLLVPIVVSLIIGCALVWWAYGRSSLVVSGEVVCGEDGVSMIYLDQVQSGVRKTIDSVELSSTGRYRFVVKSAPVTPMVYELRYDMGRAPILGRRGDHVKVSTLGSLSLNYTVGGSEETELLRTFYQNYVKQSSELNKIAARYAAMQRENEDAVDVVRECNELYRDIKHDQIKFIVTNKGTMAAVYALFQLLPGDSFIVSESSDVIYTRAVLEGISERYPQSPYVSLLKHRIEASEARIELINSVSYSDYPELRLNDMFGKTIALSSLVGKVILIDFWSAEVGSSNRNNVDLKEIYNTYKDGGFEVYQVGIDTSKSIWINTVQAQKLPWISVSDLQGTRSQSLGLYNITKIPSNILISKSGEIVGRNLYGGELERVVAAEIKK